MLDLQSYSRRFFDKHNYMLLSYMRGGMATVSGLRPVVAIASKQINKYLLCSAQLYQ